MGDRASPQLGDNMDWDFSEAVREKAMKMVEDGKVRPDETAVGVWWVQGSAEKPYRVQTDATPMRPKMRYISCTCKYGTSTGSGLVICSHAVAVAMEIVNWKVWGK